MQKGWGRLKFCALPPAHPPRKILQICLPKTAHAEHLVAWFELGYVPANGFDLAGHISA